ncbi:unnamed protein product [Hermetia illucens]|uniref:SAGA-associated factor 11 homolog n=1 Tax=Hermetia illucens TaxID=343691 RepID=A0A7R8YPD9_HERIL|nr:SAGA-associated factor 11 homolog [Hermetia illucens]CAD7077291.1 unnamed protein product [Hermetia illucens]
MADVPSADNSSDHNFEYASESELLAEYNKYMRDPNNVEVAANYLFQSLLDETILGVVFEVHQTIKTGMSEAVEGQPEDSKPFNIVDAAPDFDVFGSNTAKKSVDCTCPNCDRLVSTSRFAPHLEKCMGMGRNSSRIASRRIASAREGNGSYFGSNLSDDEDDADWSGEKRRKKIPAVRANGSKKNGKSS